MSKQEVNDSCEIISFSEVHGGWMALFSRIASGAI